MTAEPNPTPPSHGLPVCARPGCGHGPESHLGGVAVALVFGSAGACKVRRDGGCFCHEYTTTTPALPVEGPTDG